MCRSALICFSKRHSLLEKGRDDVKGCKEEQKEERPYSLLMGMGSGEKHTKFFNEELNH